MVMVAAASTDHIRCMSCDGDQNQSHRKHQHTWFDSGGFDFDVLSVLPWNIGIRWWLTWCE